MSLLELQEVKKYFPQKRKGLFGPREMLKAVDDVSFTLNAGKTLGIVGESGSGKSTLARTILHLYKDVQGKILFEGKDIVPLKEKEMAPFRREMQMIFQDPYSSLNPRMTTGEIIGETLVNQGVKDREEIRRRTLKTMELCGLSDYHYRRFPHEFSGGQRQRISIARALIVEPKLLIADEPTSALDVSIQAQIINLMEDLREELDLTYIFISHDLEVVKHISHEVAVMYLGQFMELSPKDDLYARPLHPYTASLLAAAPAAHPDEKHEPLPLTGDIPSPRNKPSGCPFHPRCPYAEAQCKEEIPEYREILPGRFVRCFHPLLQG